MPERSRFHKVCATSRRTCDSIHLNKSKHHGGGEGLAVVGVNIQLIAKPPFPTLNYALQAQPLAHGALRAASMERVGSAEIRALERGAVESVAGCCLKRGGGVGVSAGCKVL
eukprot:6187264-Pleurochrysis_carterae.AAC.3